MKTSIYLFLNKKKLFLLQFLILLIGCTSLLFFRSLTQSALDTIDSNRYEQNGDYFAVIQDGTTIESQEIQRSDFQLFGEVQVVDTNEKFPIGSMSEEFAEKQRIHLLQGRLPQASTELVVEEHVLRNNELGIAYGETIQLEYGEEEPVREFRVVGVIENFSFNRNSHIDLMITEFPAIYTVKDTFSYNENYQLLSKENILRSSAFEMEQFGIHGEFSINTLLFNGLSHYQSFHTIQTAVILLITSFSIFSLTTVYLYQKKSIHREIFLLKSFGLSKEQIIINELVGYGLIGTAGVTISSILFSTVTPFLSFTIIDQITIQLSTVIRTLLPFISVTAFLIIGIGFDLNRLIEKEYTKKISIKNNYSEIMNDKSPFFVKHLYFMFDRYPKLSLLIIFILTLVISGVSLYRILEQEQIDYFEINSSRTIDVYKERYRLDELNGQVTFEEDIDWLSWSDVNPIEAFEGIESIGARIVDEDLYIRLNNEQYTPGITRALYEQNNGQSETNNRNLMTLSSHVEWMEVEEYQELINQLMPEKEALKDIETILVTSSLNQEQQLQREEFVLTRVIQADGDYEEENWSVPIEAIIDKEELWGNDDLTLTQDVVFIIPLTPAVQEAFADRISTVSIQIDPMISDLDYGNVKEYVVEIMAGTSNSVFSDSLGSQQEVHLFRQSFQIFGRTTTIIVLFLTMGIVFAIQYSKFLDEKEKYGIYLIHGLTMKKMKIFMLIELMILFLLAVILSVLFVLFFFLANPSSESLGEYFNHLFVSIIYLFFVVSFVYGLVRRKLNKLSIKQLLSQ